MDMILASYCDMILSVKLGNRNGQISISKPLLIYSIIEAIGNGQLKENEILFSNEFIYTDFMASYCHFNGVEHNQTLNLQFYIRPFYHLGSSCFYHLVWKNEHIQPMKSNTPSAKYIRDNLLYAKLDDELWALLQSKENREYIKERIRERFLSN